MNKKLFSLSTVAVLALSMVLVNPVESKSLANSLLELDVFHAPEMGDPTAPLYKEWHYFNIIDEEQGLSYITTFMLNGDVSSSTMSAAVNLVSYSTPAGNDIKFDLYPVTMAQWSNTSPNVTIGSSSVTLEEDGYHVYTLSQDGTTEFNAVYKPEVEPSSIWTVPFPEIPYRVMNWFVAASKDTVNGTLTVNKGTANEKTYVLENVRGYHDHNWGRWLWSDDIGWDWAQASSKNNDSNNSTGKYSISLGHMTNNSHTIPKGTTLDIWQDEEIMTTFVGDDVQIIHESMTTLPDMPNNPYPTVNVIKAKSGKDKLNIRFTTEQVTPIMLPLQPEGVNGFRIVWELVGKYEVSGKINGEKVKFETNGYMEYVGELLILP
jgi:hypothetical protein